MSKRLVKNPPRSCNSLAFAVQLACLSTLLISNSAFGQDQSQSGWIQRMVPVIQVPSACSANTDWRVTECQALYWLGKSSAAHLKEEVLKWLDDGEEVLFIFRDRKHQGGYWVFRSSQNLSVTSDDEPRDAFGNRWWPNSEESLLFFGRGSSSVEVFADPEFDGPSMKLCGSSAVFISEQFKSLSGLGQNAINSFEFVRNASTWSNQPSVTLEAGHASVDFDNSTTLTWISDLASACTLFSGRTASVWPDDPSGGEKTIRLRQDQTFEICCSGPGGIATSTVSVDVGPPPVPSVTLSADPSYVPYGGSTTLTWDPKNVDFCEADWIKKDIRNPISRRGLLGSQLVKGVKRDTTYSIVCEGPGGEVRDSVRVTIGPNTQAGQLSGSYSPCSKSYPVNLTITGELITADSVGGKGKPSFTYNHTTLASSCIGKPIPFSQPDLRRGKWEIAVSATTLLDAMTCDVDVPGTVSITAKTKGGKCTTY